MTCICGHEKEIHSIEPPYPCNGVHSVEMCDCKSYRPAPAKEPDNAESASHFVSPTCKGEHCFCGQPATHKVAEEISRLELEAQPEPFKGIHMRHEFTQYVCCQCFTNIMGNATFCGLTRADTDLRSFLAYEAGQRNASADLEKKLRGLVEAGIHTLIEAGYVSKYDHVAAESLLRSTLKAAVAKANGDRNIG